MNHEQAIAILTGDREERFPLERAFAFAAFCAWLNAAHSDTFASQSMCLAVLAHAISYEGQKKFDTSILRHTDVFDPNLYLKNIENWSPISDYWMHDFFESYNDTKYIADVVRFFVGFKDRHDYTKTPSQGKAFYFLNPMGGFDGLEYHKNERMRASSMAAHQKIWKEYKRSSSFQFVRYYACTLDFNMDPRDDFLLEKLIKQAQKRRTIIDFFRKVSWVQNELRTKLDARSMDSSEYHSFPASIVPKKCTVPPLPASTYTMLEFYKANETATQIESKFPD
ncbi:hypothetical protein LMIY3S_05089 [Labrys miyagiensis]